MVPPATPRTSSGLYWGYTVRLAQSFGAVFTESPYKVNQNFYGYMSTKMPEMLSFLPTGNLKIFLNLTVYVFPFFCGFTNS